MVETKFQFYSIPLKHQSLTKYLADITNVIMFNYLNPRGYKKKKLLIFFSLPKRHKSRDRASSISCR